MRVNGIHRTPSNMSDTAKFNKNTLVIVRIRRFCTSVNITSALPVTANNRIVVYSGICMRPIDNHDGAEFGCCCECCCSSVVDVWWYDRCCWWYSSNVAFTLSITFSVVRLNVIIAEFLSHFQRDDYVTEGWFTKNFSFDDSPINHKYLRIFLSSAMGAFAVDVEGSGSMRI